METSRAGGLVGAPGFHDLIGAHVPVHSERVDSIGTCCRAADIASL